VQYTAKEAIQSSTNLQVVTIFCVRNFVLGMTMRFLPVKRSNAHKPQILEEHEYAFSSHML